MWSWVIRACQVLVKDQNSKLCVIEGNLFDDSFQEVRPWQVSECLSGPHENDCPCYCRQNETLLYARMCRHYVYAGKQYWALSIHTGFCFGRIDFERNLKRSPKSETALVPKLSPFTQLLLIKQRKPFSSSPSACSFFLLTFSSSFFHGGAAEPFPTENYSQSLSTAPSQSVPPSLCSLLRALFPSSSPSGPARKESSVMALWRENGGIHPMLCRW